MKYPKISFAAARVNAELTQEQAAERLGVKEKTLLNYEKGRYPVPEKVRAKLESVYGFPVELIHFWEKKQ